ncbi:MAG: epoxyqueuosine reductase QueH [Candidatus Omnitrophota bacterium]
MPSTSVLLHICCGPCAIYPVKALRQEGYEVAGFFYNPNIHPFSEYEKRVAAVIAASERIGLNTIHHRYDFEEMLKNMATLPDRQAQHRFCWQTRLEETARVADREGFGAFTTTLLSSPYQDIAEIARLGEKVAATYALEFLNRNFRQGFAESHQVSREWDLYHQNYCGCLYSEKESIEQRRSRR